MPRYQRKLASSKIYHIMVRGNEKKNIFIDDEDRQKFIEILHVKKKENRFDLYAYCLMDNHVHLLTKEKEASIARIMKCINVSYAMYFNNKYNRIGHLFQDRFKSENIYNDRYLLSVVRYIHNNPLKAKMISEIHNYKWSSYLEYIHRKRINKLADTGFILDMMSNNKEKALQEFIKISANIDGEEYLDIDKEVEIITMEEALNYIHNVLFEKGIKYEQIYNHKGKIKGTLKYDLVKELKGKSRFGSRKIGELLGLSKSAVNNLLLEDK